MLKSGKWSNDFIFRRIVYETKFGLLDSYPEELAYSQENVNGDFIPELPLRPDRSGLYHVAVQ